MQLGVRFVLCRKGRNAYRHPFLANRFLPISIFFAKCPYLLSLALFCWLPLSDAYGILSFANRHLPIGIFFAGAQ